MVVNMKVAHHHLVLDDMAIVGPGWLKKSQNQRGKVGKILKSDNLTIIICERDLNFLLIWFVFLWCNCVCFWYIRVSQAREQAMVALVEDLQNWLMCMWVKNGIFSLFHFSPLDLIFLDSKVILISLGTFPNHWNNSKRSISKICKNGHNT